MSKNSYLVIAIIILLAIGGFILFKKQTTQPKAEEMEQKPIVKEEPKKVESSESETIVTKNQITYTDGGFSPKPITIKLGDAVTWKNDTSDLMWIASAVHPTHLEYPGFDQLKGSEKGTTYSFKFEKIGTWKYHDHLHPGNFGSVVVE